MAQIDILKDFAPELVAQGDPVLLRFLGYAALRVNIVLFGAKADLATALLAAHLLTIAGKGDKSGAVTLQKVGELSVSFAAPTDDDSLVQTSYGREFVAMRRSIPLTPLVT